MVTDLPPIVVGIDLAKDSFAVAAYRTNGNLLATANFALSCKGLNDLLTFLQRQGSFPEGFAIALEASGPYTLPLLSWLLSHGLRTYLLNPLLIYRFRRAQSLRNTKTDDIDARTIALYLLQTRELPEPVQAIDDTSALAQEYEELSQKIAQTKTQIRQLVHGLFPELASYPGLFSRYLLNMLLAFPSAHALRQVDPLTLQETSTQACAATGKAPTLSWQQLRRMARNSVGVRSPAREQVLQSKIRQLCSLLEERDRIRQTLIQTLQKRDPLAWKSITSVSGIGDTTSALFLAQIRSIHRFENAKQLAAFAGIDPTLHQSGQYTAPAHISKRGSPHLRRTLFLMAQSAIRYSTTFRQYFQSLRERGKAYRVAVIATAHKLLRVLFALLKKRSTFREDYHALVCNS